MSEELKGMLWALCHAIGNGNYELAEELSDHYTDRLEQIEVEEGKNEI